MKRHSIVCLALVASACSRAPSMTEQPAPPQATTTRALYVGAVAPPRSFEEAIRSGTRTATGAPGSRYWQNTARYRINARINPIAKRLDGKVEITYFNNSPDTLVNLHIDLTQNFHRSNAVRNEPAEVTNGVELGRVTVQNQQLREGGTGARYQLLGTRLAILPPQPVGPGQSVSISIDYAFTIPQAGAGERMGWSQDNLFFIAYWYPQMAVYDDVVGWHPDQFVGTTEFYADFASYDYTIEMPAGWVIVGTGELENARTVLAPDVYQRLQSAETSDQVVNVIAREHLNNATASATSSGLQWHFTADSVRDVAFSATRASLWDARRTPVGDRNGDGRIDYTRIDAIYRENAPRWRQSARYSAHAVAYLSRFIGIPYPWSHMTAVEGADIIGGGMEFPMLTLIGSYTDRNDAALYAVTAHEEAHMWFPMLISSDERRYSWLDEGTTAFNENQAERDFHEQGPAFEIEDQESYLGLARIGEEGEIMRRSAYHYSPAAYGVATYDKPASVLTALRAVLGDSVFHRALREFAQLWKYKHPYPWDMWNTFEHVSGRDLDWFWHAWYHTTWVLDQAVASVSTTSTGTTIVVENRGQIPMPAFLTITQATGETITREVPVETWLSGATTASVTMPASAITRVELDARRSYPDIDRVNNSWQR